MIDVIRAAELAVSLLHIVGGLFSAGAHIIDGDNGGAILAAATAAVCILILGGAAALFEIGRVKVKQFVRKHENPPDPRHKGGPNA